MAAMASADEKHRPSQAIEGLESRLHNLEQHLTVREDDRPSEAAPERLRNLHHDIQDLTDASEAAADLLELYRKHHDDLYFPSTTDGFGAPSPTEKLAIVNACATSFPSTVSQLTSLESLSITSSEGLVALTKLTPRTASLGLTQTRQAEDLADLRSRTAALIQRWHTLSVLSVGSCWAEWEERLLRVEATVRRAEAAAAERQRQLHSAD